MSRRNRTLSYGASVVVVIAGAVCAATVPGFAGDLLMFVLVSAGLCAITTLIFLEIGLGEDRDLAREAAARKPDREHTRAAGPERPGAISRGRRRPRFPRRPS